MSPPTPVSPAREQTPTIAGPERYVRNTTIPPTLTLDLGSRRYYAVEVASDPDLFKNAAARTPQTFYASWQGGAALRTADAAETTFAIPASAWLHLRGAEILYLRVLTSSTGGNWTAPLTSASEVAAQIPRIQLHGQFVLSPEQPFRDEELLWRRDPGV